MTKKEEQMKKSFWIAGAVCMLVFGEAVYAMTRPNVNHSNTDYQYCNVSNCPMTGAHVHENTEITEEVDNNTYHQYCNVPNCPMTGAHVHEEHHANRNNTHGHHHGHGNHY